MKKFREKKEHFIIENRCREFDGDHMRFTYRNLLEKLKELSEDQLNQPVQILGTDINHDDGSIRLEPVLCVDTVENLCHVDGEISTPTHSTEDFNHHPEQIVLLRDYSPFGKDGDTSYELKDGVLVGNKTGKVVDIWKAEKNNGSDSEKIKDFKFKSAFNVPFNIWDDYYDDGFIPDGKIQQTHGYIEEYDFLMFEEKLEIVNLIYNYIVDNCSNILDKVEVAIDAEDISFKHLTHVQREKLVKKLQSSELNYHGLYIEFYSES